MNAHPCERRHGSFVVTHFFSKSEKNLQIAELIHFLGFPTTKNAYSHVVDFCLLLSSPMHFNDVFTASWKQLPVFSSPFAAHIRREVIWLKFLGLTNCAHVKTGRLVTPKGERDNFRCSGQLAKNFRIIALFWQSIQTLQQHFCPTKVFFMTKLDLPTICRVIARKLAMSTQLVRITPKCVLAGRIQRFVIIRVALFKFLHKKNFFLDFLPHLPFFDRPCKLGRPHLKFLTKNMFMRIV